MIYSSRGIPHSWGWINYISNGSGWDQVGIRFNCKTICRPQDSRINLRNGKGGDNTLKQGETTILWGSPSRYLERYGTSQMWLHFFVAVTSAGEITHKAHQHEFLSGIIPLEVGGWRLQEATEVDEHHWCCSLNLYWGGGGGLCPDNMYWRWREKSKWSKSADEKIKYLYD